MKLGILVNVMNTGSAGTSTYRLAAEATSEGHEVWVMSSSRLAYNADETVGALARRVPAGRYTSEQYLEAIETDGAIEDWINIEELDVLLLRNNPSVQNAWAQSAGIHFARLAMRRGVIVLNDPNGLAKATNKLYLETFPAVVRPRTVVARHLGRIREFLDAEGTIIIKPLQGSGGAGVFIVHADRPHNLEDIYQSISRDGYVMAQQYLPAAAEGDTRLFLMNGVPLRYQGKVAAFRRVRLGDDIRSNIHAGGKLRRAELTDTMFELAEIVRPRLVEDGMFLVGLDIVGDKLMEINVFSPGGLGSAQTFEKVDFTHAVLAALQRKVDSMTNYRRNLSNVQMATL